MNPTVVFPADSSPPEIASSGPTLPRDRTANKDSFAKAMKEAQNGTERSEPRRRPSAKPADSSAPSRGRTEPEIRPRSNRSSCGAASDRPEAQSTRDSDHSPTASRRGDESEAKSPPPNDSPAISPAADANREAEPDAPTATLTSAEGSDPAAGATPTNIIAFPPPANVVPFPLAPTEFDQMPQAQAAPINPSMGTDLAAPAPIGWSSAPTTPPAVSTRGAAPNTDVTSSSGGMPISSAGLTALSERERMTVSLRLAMAQLEADDTRPKDSAAASPQEKTSSIVPLPQPSAGFGENIVRVQFAPVPSSIEPASSPDGMVAGASPNSGPEPTEPADASTELPGVEATAAKTSGRSKPATGAASSVAPASSPVRPPNSGDSDSTRERHSRSASAGTSAAPRERNMDFTSTTAAFTDSEVAGPRSWDGPAAVAEAPSLEAAERLPATAWIGAGEHAPGARSADGIAAGTPRPDVTGSIERISSLVSRETTLFRQHGAESMAVVLRPDANTELLVHLTRHNGQIEASVRCERGDFQQLNALWSQLQESLGQQKVRLGPLEEATPDTSHFRQPGGGLSQQGQGREESARQSRADDQSMEEWPAPASPQQTSAHVRSRSGDSGRRLSTSRPGWETWA